MRFGALRGLIVAGAATVGVLFCLVAPAFAEIQRPQWTISSVSVPTNFNPTAKPGENHYRVLLTNTGGASSQGVVTITDELPEGLSVDPTGASGVNALVGSAVTLFRGQGADQNFSCVLATCTFSGVVIPDETLELTFPVDLSVGAQALAPVTNTIRVSGGGADAAVSSLSTTISEQPAKFAIPVGAATTAFSTLQAGGHPDITTTYGFTSVGARGAPAGDPKDIIYKLPPGFASDFADTPACADAAFILGECPTDSQVGVTTVDTTEGDGLDSFFTPVYNLVPETGQLATLAFDIGSNAFVQGQVSLRTGDYGATVTFHNIEDAILSVVGGSLTVWGDPSDPVHDPLRWHIGPYETPELGYFGTSDEGVTPAPYFTNPTSCAGVLESEFQSDSWQEPGKYSTALMPYGPMGGCDSLLFEPQTEVQPSSNAAETPTGLNVVFQIPQHYENAHGVVAPNLDDTTVTLPEGMTLNPSAGAGLQACTEAQFAYEGTVTEPEAGLGCPRESKLGSLKVRSPGVPNGEEATGSLFLAKPYENKFDTLIAVYLVARIPDRGVVVTTVGKVEPNPVTGRLVTRFDENPQLPLSQLTFTFHQGATSPLVTPPSCGVFTSNADLTPWSVPGQEYLLSSTFEINSGVDGKPCPSGGVPPFKPQVISGTEDNNAGSYAPFYLRIVREDGEQELTKFSTTLPPGLTGNLTGIPFCPDANIEASRSVSGAEELEYPSCPLASEIGHTIVGAGVGGLLAQTPGKLYLGGPYHGAPLSVVSITAAKVGPFDLGTVVIRFALRINPITAQVEIDGSSSDPIPHIIDGIVVHVRDIRAYVNRSKFILNPTSCNQMSIADTIVGAGANPANPAGQDSSSVLTPFQGADCSSLAFKPSFKVSTSGKTSRKAGASLSVKLTYPIAPQGTQANIRSVKVDLPKQLPSNLKTLQKACPFAVFDANPANCSVASRVGSATALTPILPVPLTGPAYFVSYGGLKFPELVVVLQGYGFTIDLHGETYINEKTGITSSTFRTVPDEPVTSFALTLPQGANSALDANTNLCAVKGGLKMPTLFVAQNGVTIKQSTPIAVSGCAKHKTKAKKTKKSKQHGKPKKKT